MACIVFEEPNVRGNNRWERISSSSMCVCVNWLQLWHSERLAPCCLCVCDVCVLVSLHLGMFAICAFVNVVQGCAGKQSTIITVNEMMKCACSFNFLHKCRAWLGLIAWHFSAPRYQGLITLLPSRLIWGVQILSSTVLHSPIMFAESILMIPFRTLSVMSLGSNKQISVLICMSFKHLHLYLEDIWAVCGTWRKWMNRVV